MHITQTICAEGIFAQRGYFPISEGEGEGIQSGTRDLTRFVDADQAPATECPVAARLSENEFVWLCNQSVLLGTREDMDDILHAVAKIRHAAS